MQWPSIRLGFPSQDDKQPIDRRQVFLFHGHNRVDKSGYVRNRYIDTRCIQMHGLGKKDGQPDCVSEGWNMYMKKDTAIKVVKNILRY